MCGFADAHMEQEVGCVNMAAHTPENVSHLQARFFTKDEKYSIPNAPFSVPSSVGVKELSSLINSLRTTSGADGQLADFDFLINGEFLRVTLLEFLEHKGTSLENVIDIEYTVRSPAPTPKDSFLHDDWVSCVEAQGIHIISGCYDNSVKIWSLTGECLLSIPAHAAPVKDVTWIPTPEGATVLKFISTSHDGTALIWEWNQSDNAIEVVNSCKGHSESVECVAVDGTSSRFCTGSWDRMLKIWTTETSHDSDPSPDHPQTDPPQRKKKKTVPVKVPLLTLSAHKECITAVGWCDVNEICTGSWDHTIRVWDVQQARDVTVIPCSKVILDLSYSGLNRTIVTASNDSHLRQYDPRASDGAVVQCLYTSHAGWVSSVEWSRDRDNLFISGSYDNTMKMWDTRSPKVPLYSMSGHTDKILDIDWSIPEYMISAGADDNLRIFQQNL